MWFWKFFRSPHNLTVSLALGFLAISSSLTPERVKNIIPLSIKAPSAIMFYARMQGTPIGGTSLCQFPCYQDCETRNLFAQNMPETIDGINSQLTRAHWLESQLTRVSDVCPLTNGKTIWLNSYSTRVTGVCPSTEAQTIQLDS